MGPATATTDSAYLPRSLAGLMGIRPQAIPTKMNTTSEKPPMCTIGFQVM